MVMVDSLAICYQFSGVSDITSGVCDVNTGEL